MEAFGNDSVLTREEAHICSKSSNSTEPKVYGLTGLAAIADSYAEDDETSAEIATDFANFDNASTDVECCQEELHSKSISENFTDVVGYEDALIKVVYHKVVEANNKENACKKGTVSVSKSDSSLEKEESKFSNGNVVYTTSLMRKAKNDFNEVVLKNQENIPSESVSTGTTMVESANTSGIVKESKVVGHSVAEVNNIGNTVTESVGIGNIVAGPVSITHTYKEAVEVGYTITDSGNTANIGNLITEPVSIGDVTKEPVKVGSSSGSSSKVENERTETDNSNTNTASSSDTADQVYAMSIIDYELDDICTKETADQIKDTSGADSSFSDSSSDSDDESSSDQSSTSSDDDLEDIRREIEKEEEQALKGPPKTKSEVFIKDLPEIPDLDITIDGNVQLVELGVVFSIVELMVVVKAFPQTPALDSESILFLESRSILGLVFETFGPIQTPFYSVRFNMESDISSKNIHVGDKVFYAPDVIEYSHYVFVAQLKKFRGSDASWEHDEEPPQEAVEYSDDEEEAKAKANRKKERMAKRGYDADNTTQTTEESGSNFHQGFKRGNRKRTWQYRPKGQTVNQNQNQGMPPSSAVLMPHPTYRGPTPWHGSTLPLLAPETPYRGPSPHEAMHFQGLSEGVSRGIPPVMLPPLRPPPTVPVGQIPVTDQGPMSNVPRTSFGPPRPLAGGPGIQNPWLGSPSPGLSPRYPIPAPQYFQNPRGNIQSFPERESMGFGIPPPPPPPPPPPM